MTKINLEELVSKDTMKILNDCDIYTIEEFYEKCSEKFFWGELSLSIEEEDRITLEKTLLKNRVVDTFAYYKPREEYTEGNFRDYIIKYDYLCDEKGATFIITSPKIHTAVKHIVLDRLKRTATIYIQNNRLDNKSLEIKIPYKKIEYFFEYKIDIDKIENLHALGFFPYTEKMVLTHLSGKEETFGCHIMNVPDVERFLGELGVDIKEIEESLNN